ncbi:MAG: Fic family protein [Magnetococcales bacterium]|nr:Fic family protein [Magnetococcales bacterium]
MEPMLIRRESSHHAALSDLVLELGQKSIGLRYALPRGVASALADLLRVMNCYYSNLIEGHNTHPIDIERALRQEYSADAKKRDLQLEAKAHITVQEWIDGGGLGGKAVSVAAIGEIHRRFYAALPEELPWVTDPDSGERFRVEAGAWRRRDVRVGLHVPVSAAAVPRFLQRFEEVYGGLGKAEAVLAAAAAHHRLLWLHPFLDGNGRVARLMSHATLVETLDTGAIWSIARGLARNVEVYKRHLAACDQTRRNDLDGRGNLSEENLVAFTRFFLETCLDQVAFMAGLLQPELLRDRIMRWAEEEIQRDRIPPRSNLLLEAILYRGEIPRAASAGIVGTGERQARRIVSELSRWGVLVADDMRVPLRLGFPATLASHWLPGLFPDKVEEA